MPIKTQNDLPVKEILERENIFVMDENRASHQNIRQLEIAIVNLMPLKEDTELQILRSLSNTPIQVNVTFVATSTHEATHTSLSHLNKFYETFDDIKDRYFDGLIITGAPVELMEYEEVDYWDEICKIMEWSKTHAFSTLHLCWGAQAGLYYHYGRRAASDVGCSAYQDPVCPPVDFFRRIGNDGLWLAGGYGRTAGPPQKQGDQYQR